MSRSGKSWVDSVQSVKLVNAGNSSGIVLAMKQRCVYIDGEIWYWPPSLICSIPLDSSLHDKLLVIGY